MSLVPFVHVLASLEGARPGDLLPLAEDERHHLTRVLRLGPGAAVEVADGRGAVVEATLTVDGVELSHPPRWHPVPRPRLTVAQAVPKGRKLDEVVRQVAELGGDRLVPVRAERSVGRPAGERGERLRARAEAVARAAAEQARSPWILAVDELMAITALTAPHHRAPADDDPRPARPGHGPAADRERDEGGSAVLVAHPGGTPLPAVVATLGEVREVIVAIGPEGGWTDGELRSWEAGDARVVGLGPTVLRTEHAAAAGVAVIAALLGRWG